MAKSYYIRRVSPEGRLGWTGSIRSKRQAEKEATAWRSVDHTAEVVENTAEVRAEVRAWERSVRERRGTWA